MIAQLQIDRGGSLSPQMIQDMVDISTQVQNERQSQFDVAVEHAKNRAEKMGLDPQEVVPDIYQDPSAPPPKAPAPLHSIPSDAIALLKQHAKDAGYRRSFDETFGDGMADKVAPQ
jgi:hypothetical protein